MENEITNVSSELPATSSQIDGSQAKVRCKCLYKVTEKRFGWNGETVLEWIGECGQEEYTGEYGIE